MTTIADTIEKLNSLSQIQGMSVIKYHKFVVTTLAVTNNCGCNFMKWVRVSMNG